MAQTASNARATPFPVPPGLEPPAEGARADGPDVFRKAVLDDVEAKVAERVEEMWQKGKHMLTQVQQKQQEKVELLTQEVTECLQRTQALEKENESLKQAVATLIARLSLLGLPPLPGGLPSPGCASVPTTVPSSVASSDVFTPVRLSNGGDGYPPLPEVPEFPFPSKPLTPSSKAPPLLLSEALPTTPPTLTPQPPAAFSLAFALGHPYPEVAPPYLARPGVYSFTLRKADQTELGLNVAPDDTQKVLLVESIRAEGAVDAWNRQCVGSGSPERALFPGDRIVCVNEASYDPDAMLEECKTRQLLRITIVRGDVAPPELPGLPTNRASTATKSPTFLRADASEFVPSSKAPDVNSA
jgi:hypothetical protein